MKISIMDNSEREKENKPAGSGDAIQIVAFAAAVTGASAVVGMYTTAKREQTKLRAVVGAGSPAVIATKALLIGSAFAIGAFTFVSSAFVMVSGVRSFPELGEYVDRNFRTAEGYRLKQERRKKDENEMKELARLYPHYSPIQLAWKQFRMFEDIPDEDDERDEKVASGELVLNANTDVNAQEKVAEETGKEKHSNSIFHIAYKNLKLLIDRIID